MHCHCSWSLIIEVWSWAQANWLYCILTWPPRQFRKGHNCHSHSPLLPVYSIPIMPTFPLLQVLSHDHALILNQIFRLPTCPRNKFLSIFLNCSYRLCAEYFFVIVVIFEVEIRATWQVWSEGRTDGLFEDVIQHWYRRRWKSLSVGSE